MTIAAAKSDRPPLSEAEFIAGFHAIGEERYHHKHPFHLLMHEGKLTRGQLQAWALNSRAAKIPHSAWHGANASSITTATAKNPAASKNGCVWWKRRALRASKP